MERMQGSALLVPHIGDPPRTDDRNGSSRTESRDSSRSPLVIDSNDAWTPHVCGQMGWGQSHWVRFV
jgi:hypothetical protein